MTQDRVTKKGRPRQYESDAERQRAYRERRAKKERERIRPQVGRRVYVDPNEVMDKLALAFSQEFEDTSFFQLRHLWRPDLDRRRIPDWIASLKAGRRNLNRFMRALKRV